MTNSPSYNIISFAAGIGSSDQILISDLSNNIGGIVSTQSKVNIKKNILSRSDC